MNQPLSFDELNVLSENRRSEPYKEYFGKMSISDKEKKDRITFSEKMEEVILYILALSETMIDNDEVDHDYIEKQLFDRYIDVLSLYIVADEYLENYISDFSKQIVSSTLNHSEDAYYFSRDRAMFISECEANTSLNYRQYIEAIKNGKKYKTWVDIGDNRERKSHIEVGGTTIPIKDTFAVGSSLMLFPKDTSLGANSSEIVNCRCSIKYS